ncbi:MAG: CoA transferase [Acidobacteriota bacterium]|nr:CoA transferase [Acidobacteriota bacterium]
MAPRRPLEGVRVLDLTRLLPGAYATLMLAELGAEVIKVEDPAGGDPARDFPPRVDGTSVYFRVLNRNKRSVTLNLRSPQSAAVLDALVARSDILVESFRPQTARRLGVDAATLRARHPRLVCCSITGFGQYGPYTERPAHDVNYVALAGLFGVDEQDVRAPRVPRMLLADIGAALSATSAMLAGLFARERTGEGSTIDVPIHEAALSWLLFPAARWLVDGSGDDPAELPITGREACYNIYRTADDRFVALGALETKFWRVFCERVGRPDLIPLQAAGGDVQARVRDEVAAIFGRATRQEWLDRFRDVDICLTPVNGVPEALEDPHLRARGAVVEQDGTRFIRMPIVFATPGDPSHALRVPVQPAPALGADTDAVLADAGLDQARRQRLRADGIV